MPVSYSAPPQFPELLSSSGYYATLQSLMMVTQNGYPQTGGLGHNRDLVRNWVPKQTSGLCSAASGEPPIVVPNAFPFNPPADAAYTYDYTLRCTNGTRCLSYPYVGYYPSGASNYGTYFCVFMLEDIDGFNIYGTGTTFAGIGGFLPACLYQGQDVNNAYNYGCIWGVYSNGTGLYMGNMQSSGGSYGYCTGCPVVPGRWYAFAACFSDVNATGVGGNSMTDSLNHMQRFYLHDLTNNNRISTTGDADQTFYVSGNNYTNATYSSYPFNIQGGSVLKHDMVLFPGKNASFGQYTLNGIGSSDFIGQVKMQGIDAQLWDDSGANSGTARWVNIPAAFTGTDPFSAFVSNIYGMVGSTYTTGSTVPTLCNNSSTTQYDSGGKSVTYPYMSTSSTGPAGVNSNVLLVAAGDVWVTRTGNTSVDLTVSRPQAATVAPSTSWTWKLYASQTRETTPTAGDLITTITGVAGNPVFTYTPANSGVWFVTIVASDGVNAYTYAETPVILRPFPNIKVAFAGNSILTGTGHTPDLSFSRAMNSYGICCNTISLSLDGTTSSDWLPTAATSSSHSVNWFATNNLYGRLKHRLATETPYVSGGQYDAVFWQLQGNDGILTSDANYVAIASQLLSDGYTKKVVFLAPPWQLAGHTLPSNASGVSDSLAIVQGATNGSTILLLGKGVMGQTMREMIEQNGDHPSPYMAVLEGTGWASDYYSTVINPPASGSSGPIIISG